MSGQEIAGLVVAFVFVFMMGFTIGEWVEERRRNHEWWASRKERP
jgi:hypothetical protein